VVLLRPASTRRYTSRHVAVLRTATPDGRPATCDDTTATTLHTVRSVSQACLSRPSHDTNRCVCSLLKRCQFPRASQFPGMRAQTFHARRIMEVASRFKIQPVGLSITCIKRVRAHPRHVTRTSQLASCTRGLKETSNKGHKQ
jgi:hypothetical protein